MNSHELELIQRTAERDYAAMTELYELYSPRLTRFLQRITQDSEVIEELVNETLLIVWQRAGEFRGDSAVSTWILGIAYRKGIDAVRNVQRYTKMLEKLEFTRPQAVMNEITEERDLNTLLTSVTAEQRAVADLSFHFGYSYSEIAEILDVPVNTVKTRMFYARKTMQGLLKGAVERKK